MKKLIILFLIFGSFSSQGQSLYFPPTNGNSWDTLSAFSLGWCTNYLDTLDDYLVNENSRAFILLKDGKIVHEKYFNGFHLDSAHAWNSAGKTMTAFLIGLAQQENKLSINHKTSDYLGIGWTSAPQAKEDLITIKHQLSMNSGLDDSLDPYCTDDTCLQYLSDAGTRWAYHNGPYTLLQDVLQSATGLHPTIYRNQKMLSSTGISGAFIKIGYNKIFFSNPRSMARFGLLMLNKGIWNGTPILTDTNYYNQLITPSQHLNNSYGYLWWLNGQSSFMLPSTQVVFLGKLYPNMPDDAYAALGADNQLLVVVPSRNIVFIRMGNAASSNLIGPQMVHEIWQILDKLMCAPQSVNNIASLREVQIFPVPTKDEITIVATDYLAATLYSLQGHKLGATNTNVLNVAELPEGFYLLGVRTKSGVIYKKLLKK